CNSDKSAMIELPSLFADQMVLQRNTEVSIWGTANSLGKIEVTGSWGKKSKVEADSLGNWLAKIETPEAGGPYELTIKNRSKKIIIHDVMVGEVWLCSGQSNMEMTMNGFSSTDTILGATKEIKEAKYNGIRMFTVQKAISEKPEKDCNGQWIVCSPETVGNYSATGYYFGKKIHKDVDVPVGLIHSSWGGTPVESWISDETLKKDKDFVEIVNKIEGTREDYMKYREWLTSHEIIKISDISNDSAFKDIDFNDSICAHINCDDSNWETMELPILWEEKIGSFDGAIWFRKQINLDDNWKGKNLKMSLGPIDDMDIVYFNGVKIGGFEKDGFWDKPREYEVPAEIVTAGINQIAIRVIDNRGGGGLYGMPEELFLSLNKNESISLAGEWKYIIVAEYFYDSFYLFDFENDEYKDKPELEIDLSAFNPTMLYNAMIAPLIRYNIKGAIWYQGESNVRRANQYARIFPALINDWRNKWNLGEFPFYFVQIAPYNYSGGFEGTESGYLRDAQRRTLSLPNTGMAVTLDIGDFNNIHPANKKDVGERLALWALANDYEKELVCSGPLYLTHEIIDDMLIITFDNVGAGLVFKDNLAKEFEICGADMKFRKAQVMVNNGSINLYHPKIKKPVAARYALKNGAEASLFNIEGLPASSFTTEEVLP
ncbi:sialate O-acetylesterase, partial [Bacteroidota bacterium]